MTALLVLGFAIWTHVIAGQGRAAQPGRDRGHPGRRRRRRWLTATGREGWAFAATTVAMAATVVSIFVELYPNVMVSSTNAAYNLTVPNAASGSTR